MVDLDALFFHHPFELAVADRVRHIPARAQRMISRSKITAFEFDHRGAPRCQDQASDHISKGWGAQLCDRTREILRGAPCLGEHAEALRGKNFTLSVGIPIVVPSSLP